MRAFEHPGLHLYIAKCCQSLVCRAAAGLDKRAACRQWHSATVKQQMHSSKWCSHGAKAFLTATVCTSMAGKLGATLLGAML